MSIKHQPYSAYTSDVSGWMGRTPVSWTIKRVKYVAQPSAEKLNDKPDGSIYVALENIESNTSRLLLENQVETVESAVNVFHAGDVLFCKLRPYLAKVILADFQGVCTTELLVLKPELESNGSFLRYQLLCDGFISETNALTYGAKMPRVSAEQVGNLPLPVPPLSEQEAIAAFLDRETARIDALIARKERLLERLEEKRKAIISEGVTRGLDASVPMKDSGVEWLGQVPEGWAILPLKRVGAVRYGLGQPPAEQESGTPLLRATNVDAGKITEKGMMYVDITDVPNSRNVVLSAGEIIVVRSGAYTGDSAIVPPAYAGSIAGYDMVLTINKGIDVFYGWQLLSQHVEGFQFELQKMRAAQPHLNAEELMETIVVVPPESEQQAIAAYLDAQTAKLDALRQKMKQSVEKLSEYRTSLISAAVTGKIDVRGEVPDQEDVPA